MTVLAAAPFAAVCEGDSDPTTVETVASVRFFNATTEMAGMGVRRIPAHQHSVRSSTDTGT